MKQLSVATGDNKDLTLPEENSVILFATVSPATQTSGNPYEFEWHLLPSSQYDQENAVEMTGKHSQKFQLTKVGIEYTQARGNLYEFEWHQVVSMIRRMQ